MKKSNFVQILVLAAMVLFVASCSKSDEFKQYNANGENSYTGKLDSAKVFSGRLRVRLTGILPADPKITKTVIWWNDKRDSIVFPVIKGGTPQLFDKIFNVDEGVKIFKIQTFDAAGNASVVVNATGIVYGPRYESGLLNRPNIGNELLSNGSTVMTWDNFDTTSGAKGTISQYTTVSNMVASVYTPVSQPTSTLPNFKSGTTISYKTMYLPNPTVIDTFYSPSQTLGVKTDITSLYLSNTGPGFQRATFDGRWGTLAAPWITNAAAKNKGGINGGYSSDAGGVINWETWNNTPVTNGIVYQATSSPLPAGKYVVSFDEYSEIQANSSVYCVAAAGGTGIPVLANLSTALGYVALYNGTTIGGTSPSATDTRSFSFTLATAQVVSIGFLANIVGNGNPGSYLQVKRIQLYSNN
jgi:hypothetical protein